LSADDLSALIADAGAPIDDRALADLPLTDLGNRTRFLLRCGEDFASGEGDLKTWKAWDGVRWVSGVQARRLVLLAAQRVAEALRDELKALEGDSSWGQGDDEKEIAKARGDRLKAFRGWIKTSCSQGGINAMIAAAAPHLVKDDAIWDRLGDVLVTPNATLTISGGAVEVLEGHRREHYITHCTGVRYQPDADCPRWKAAVATWFPDERDRAYFQRCLGSCLVDSARDQKFLVWQGAGRNSKTFAMTMMRFVIGDYHLVMDAATLLDRQRGGGDVSPDLARLQSRPRLVSAEEPERGKALSEGLIKALSGGGPGLARGLYEGLGEFTSCFKMFLILNELPTIKGGDEGIWRRLQRLVWRVTFRSEDEPEDDRPLAADIDSLRASLEAEGPGILNWLIDGCSEWMIEGGLKPPPRVLEDTLEWRSVSDTLGRFLAECCERGADKRVEVGKLFDCYSAWAKREGLDRVMTKAQFARALTTSKQIRTKKSNGFAYRMEIALSEGGKRVLDQAADDGRSYEDMRG